jgi:hypothetical protein
MPLNIIPKNLAQTHFFYAGKFNNLSTWLIFATCSFQEHGWSPAPTNR